MSIFVKFTGPIKVEGEVKDASYQGFIDCTSFTYGNERASGESATGQTRRRSDVTIKDITLEKEMDTSTIPLLKAVAMGVIFPLVEIRFTSSYTDSADGNARKPFYELDLGNVMVTSFDQSGSPDEAPTESFSLNFEEIDISYISYDENGKLKNTDPFGWLVQQGKAK